MHRDINLGEINIFMADKSFCFLSGGGMGGEIIPYFDAVVTL